MPIFDLIDIKFFKKLVTLWLIGSDIDHFSSQMNRFVSPGSYFMQYESEIDFAFCNVNMAAPMPPPLKWRYGSRGAYTLSKQLNKFLH